VSRPSGGCETPAGPACRLWQRWLGRWSPPWSSWPSTRPAGAKAFLLALAVVDDIAAVTVIAIAYTSQLALGWLAVAAVGVLAGALLLRWVVLPVLGWGLLGLLGVGVWRAAYRCSPWPMPVSSWTPRGSRPLGATGWPGGAGSAGRDRLHRSLVRHRPGLQLGPGHRGGPGQIAILAASLVGGLLGAALVARARPALEPTRRGR
jgi:hypothetical protein